MHSKNNLVLRLTCFKLVVHVGTLMHDNGALHFHAAPEGDRTSPKKELQDKPFSNLLFLFF